MVMSVASYASTFYDCHAARHPSHNQKNQTNTQQQRQEVRIMYMKLGYTMKQANYACIYICLPTLTLSCIHISTKSLLVLTERLAFLIPICFK